MFEVKNVIHLMGKEGVNHNFGLGWKLINVGQGYKFEPCATL
jgi:hypothetical protein